MPPDLAHHKSTSRVVLLNMAHSGAGKTGAISCLANAGYELFFLDFDNGCDILRAFVKPEFQKNVHIVTLKDQMTSLYVPGLGKGSKPRLKLVVKGQPTAFDRAITLINDFKDGEDKFGAVESWDNNRILIIDSTTMMGKAALDAVLFANNKIGQQPSLPDYGQAMDMMEGVFAFCNSDSLRCHIIVNAHIVHIGGGEKQRVIDPQTGEVSFREADSEDGEAHPTALGRKLPPKVRRFFNTVISMEVEVVNGRARPKIVTQTIHENIKLKNTMPTKIPAELPIEDGLLTIFNTLVGPRVQPSK